MDKERFPNKKAVEEQKADLVGADLTKANLGHASLAGANLDGADLTDVKGLDN